jgi:hypothetical protein
MAGILAIAKPDLLRHHALPDRDRGNERAILAVPVSNGSAKSLHERRPSAR